MPEARPLISAKNAQPPFFIGVDLGGTSIKLGVVDSAGGVLGQQAVPTEVAAGPAAAISRIAQALGPLVTAANLRAEQIAAIGLGAPGMRDAPQGLLLEAANLPGWGPFPLRDELSRATGREVTYVNDAAAAGFGEYWVGSGKAFSSMVLYTLGTGVGGAIILDGVPLDGAHGNGAELGHTLIDYNATARSCPCGQRGHLEAYVGAGAVVRRATERMIAGEPTTLAQRVAQGETLSPHAIAEEAEHGDPLAERVVLETARYLGVAVANILHTIDPDGVVLGGAMTFGGSGSPLGTRFLAEVRAEVARRALGNLAEQTAIEFALLGGDAGFIGAAGLAASSSCMGKARLVSNPSPSGRGQGEGLSS